MKRVTILFIIAFGLFTACQMQKVVVNVYTPPRIILPPEVRSVVVTSRYVPATGPYEDVQWGAYESVDSLKWKMSESIVDTLAKRMAKDNSYLVKARHFPRMLRNNDGNLPELVPWDGLATYTKKELVQSALILEGFDLVKSPVTVTGSEGNFSAGFFADVRMAMRLYEPDKRRLIDDSVYTFRSEFTGRGKTADEARGNLPEEKKALFEACSNAAGDYYNLIKPGAEKVERYYFPKGDTSLVKGDLAIKEGKWGRAESKWKWLAYNAKDTVVQGKASYNMALCCEKDGRLNQAIGFARRSQRLYPAKKTEDYIRLLEKRINEIENQVTKGAIIKKW